MRGDRELLQQVVADIEGNEQLRIVGEVVAGRVSQLADEMADLTRAEITRFGESTDKAMLKVGWEHGLAHATKISELLRGESVGDLRFVEEFAALGAEKRFAINDMLHTYRIGHRVMWACMRDTSMQLAQAPEEGLRTAMLAADFTIRYTNVISTALTRAFIQREKALSSTRVRQTRLLFDELALGRVSSSGARLVADSIGLGKLPFVLVSFQEAHLDGDTQGLPAAEVLERRLARSGADVLIDDSENVLLALIVLQNNSAQTRDKILRQIETTAKEFDFFCGISFSTLNEGDFPFAFAEAVAALRYVSPEVRIIDLTELSVHEVFIDNRHLDVERLLPAWFRELNIADRASGGALRETIAAYADSDLSVKGAARNLDVHPNTVRFRLSKIEKITGVSPKSFRGLQELLTVISIGRKQALPALSRIA